MFPHQLMMFDERTHLCLHWCYAQLSAVQELGTYAAEVQSHGAGLRSVFHHQLMMFSEQNLLITSHHTQQVSPTCACIDVACVSSQTKQCQRFDAYHS